VGRELNHSEVMDLLGAYALDAVDGSERDAIERHLQDCVQCRREVAEHREVASMLASGWLPAPEGVWDRIAGALEETPPPLRMPSARSAASLAAPTPAEPPPASPPDGPPPAQPGVVSLDEERRRRRPMGPMARAVAAVGIAASVAVVAVVGLNSLAPDDGSTDVADVAAAAARRPDARNVVMRSPDGRLTADAVVLPDGTGYVLDANLPELPPHRTYQLWAVVGQNKISIGVLGRDVGPVAFRAAADVSAFAITNEVAGGVIVTHEPPTVVGTPT
jgi:anti-sigma factor RsiW